MEKTILNLAGLRLIYF